MNDTTAELERAVEEVLALLDRAGSVDEAYLVDHYGELAPQIRECLDLDEGFREGAPPRVLGDHRVGRLLGTGATSRVYEGVPVEGGAPVALKILHPWLAESEGMMSRFRREERAGASIDHPNVVRIHGTFVKERDDRKWAVIISELVDAPTLRDRLGEGSLGVREAARVAAEIADALAAAHAAGVVHRDLKPGNVAVTMAGDIKVLDLGLAWLDERVTRLTRSGDFVGTLAYAAPEQLNGFWGPRDGRLDLFALGVLLYELLTGETPWGPARAESNALRRHALAPARVTDVATGVPAELDALVMELLASRPADRPHDAAAVRDRLVALGSSCSPRPAELVPRDERADAGLRMALYQALDGSPRAVVVTAGDPERLDAFVDAFEGRLRRGALEARVSGSLRSATAGEGLGVAILRDAAPASDALRRFAADHEGRSALAIAALAAEEPPEWLTLAERAGEIRVLGLDDTPQPPD